MTLLSICENVIRAKAEHSASLSQSAPRKRYLAALDALRAAEKAYDTAITPKVVKELCEALRAYDSRPPLRAARITLTAQLKGAAFPGTNPDIVDVTDAVLVALRRQVAAHIAAARALVGKLEKLEPYLARGLLVARERGFEWPTGEDDDDFIYGPELAELKSLLEATEP